jgi:hypothetical protein
MGVDTLIEAMACLKLKDANRPVHLTIIGGDLGQPRDN